MTPDEIAKSYEQIADRWDSAVFPARNGMEQHERAIEFVENRGRALDIGCGGSGRIIQCLIDSGFDVEGLDLCQPMLELAKKRHPEVRFHHSDIVTWELPTTFDFISAWDSVWHVPLASQEAVLKKLLTGLNPGGVCIFTTGGVDEPGELIDWAMGPEMYYSTLGIPRILEVLHENDCLCRHLEYDQFPELHVYIIAQRA